MKGRIVVYPLYYKFSDADIPENVHRCEEISRQCGAECVFRIVEHTNYHLSSILTDNGYGLEKCGVVGECDLTGDAEELCVKGKMPDGNLQDIGMEDILRFAAANGIVRILADIPRKGELPEQYGRLGFRRAYRYRCYQKNQEEKSSRKEE